MLYYNCRPLYDINYYSLFFLNVSKLTCHNLSKVNWETMSRETVFTKSVVFSSDPYGFTLLVSISFQCSYSESQTIGNMLTHKLLFLINSLIVESDAGRKRQSGKNAILLGEQNIKMLNKNRKWSWGETARSNNNWEHASSKSKFIQERNGRDK